MSKERPILFNGPMVRAVINGTKTQTRRIVKPEGAHHLFDILDLPGNPTGEWAWCSSSHCVSKHIFCPYGHPGDRLWGREAWCGQIDSRTSQLIYNEDGNTYKCLYRADGHHVVLDDGDGFTKFNRDGSEASPWKPSIHMPRWASRITLEVVSVRVERLQDISEADAKAEGMAWDDAVYDYSQLWNAINGADSWAANPWVWAIEFKRIES